MKKLTLLLAVFAINSMSFANLQANNWDDCITDCMEQCLIYAHIDPTASMDAIVEQCAMSCGTECENNDNEAQ